MLDVIGNDVRCNIDKAYIIIVKDNYEEPGVVTSGETCFNVFFVLYGENVFDLYTNFLRSLMHFVGRYYYTFTHLVS